jgi:hypothetical protein
MCREALGLGEPLAWSFWRALSKSQWSGCREFRAALVRYDALPTPRPEADRQRVRELMTPEHLVGVIESLVRQQLLLKRDAGPIEEAIRISVVDNYSGGVIFVSQERGYMAEPEKRPVGRPRGPETAIVNLRIPMDLLKRLEASR